VLNERFETLHAAETPPDEPPAPDEPAPDEPEGE
jgi:hypothetical protein